MADSKKTPPSSRGSLFTNFEDVQVFVSDRGLVGGKEKGDGRSVDVRVGERV